MFTVCCRLMSYRQWLLAYRIAGVLRNIPGAQQPPLRQGTGANTALGPRPPPMGQDQVLMQWACAKISAASGSSSQVDDAHLKVSTRARSKGMSSSTMVQAQGMCCGCVPKPCTVTGVWWGEGAQQRYTVNILLPLDPWKRMQLGCTGFVALVNAISLVQSAPHTTRRLCLFMLYSCACRTRLWPN